jgi:hypothetical protein
MKKWLAVVSAGVIAGFAMSAVADGDHDHNRLQRVFRAKLVSLNEVPSVSSEARGQFYAVVAQDGQSFTYWLTYSGLEGAVTQSHIHLGNHHTNGGVSVFLCKTTQTATAPDCTQDTSAGAISDTITAADVIGPTAQGITAGEFDEILAAIRARSAYVNVHSALFPGGEIRGQID